MQSMTRAAHTRRHLSRHERQRQAPSRGVLAADHQDADHAIAGELASDDLELIDRLVRRDRTAVSTALLAIAGIGAGEASRRAVLSRIAEAASWAQAEGAIGRRRTEQIGRHIRRALERDRQSAAA